MALELDDQAYAGVPSWSAGPTGWAQIPRTLQSGLTAGAQSTSRHRRLTKHENCFMIMNNMFRTGCVSLRTTAVLATASSHVNSTR